MRSIAELGRAEERWSGACRQRLDSGGQTVETLEQDCGKETLTQKDKMIMTDSGNQHGHHACFRSGWPEMRAFTCISGCFIKREWHIMRPMVYLMRRRERTSDSRFRRFIRDLRWTGKEDCWRRLYESTKQTT